MSEEEEDKGRACSAQLLRTWKTIHQEAKPVLYKENIFVSTTNFVHDRVPDSAMIPDSVSAMVRHLALLPRRWDGPDSDTAYFGSYQTDLKLFLSPNFTNLRSLRLRLHAFGRWPVDGEFEEESWKTSPGALSLPEWKDITILLLSRDQPPEFRIVVWLIRTQILFGLVYSDISATLLTARQGRKVELT